jgi:hypothetical protein
VVRHVYRTDSAVNSRHANSMPIAVSLTILHFLNTVDFQVTGWYNRHAKVTGLILFLLYRRSPMDDVCSLACPTTAGAASVATARDASRSLLRWIVVGAASAVLFVLAAMQAASVGAAAPTAYQYPGIVAPVGTTPTATTATMPSTTGYPANTVVSTYIDPRYCNGLVSVATDGSGNLIDICTATGQRFLPVFPDYGYGVGFGANFIAPNYFNGGFIAPGTANGITCNGIYGCPFGGGFIGNTNFNYLNGNNCNFFGNCTAAFPAGGTVVDGVVLYNDNRFCTDGKVAFVPGRGYFCQNGGPLVTNNTTTTVNCGNFFFDGCGIYRPFEANSAASAAPQQTTPVTAYSAPAAPKAAAPVAQAVVAPQAPVTAPAAAAPAAKVATTMNAPTAQQAAPVVVKAQTATVAPAASTSDPDDHRG